MDESTTTQGTPPDRLKELAFAYVRDVHHLGDELPKIDPARFAERIKRIHAGLNAEKEFQALVAWLGQCTAICAVDDSSSVAPELRAPDCILISNVNGQQVPALVEVKSTNDDELIWSDQYISSLRQFVNTLQLPLLVAWKHHELWTLVDTAHFELRQTAYHLTFERAMKENLMSLLCGEVIIELEEEFQFIIEGEVAEALPPQEELLPEDTYTIKFTNALFSTKHGHIKNLENEFFWLFDCAKDDNHVERPTQQTIKIIHHPEAGTVFPLTRVLLAQLASQHNEEDGIDWNAELRRRPFPSSGAHYRNILRRGIDLGIIRYVIHQVPQTDPPFIKPAQPAAGQ